MNYNKIVIFDWGGIIESHRKGEYNLDVAVENLIKHFNPKENKNIVERYYNRSVELGINDTKDIKEDKWFKQIKEEFNLECTPQKFYDYYIKEFDNIEDVVEYVHSLKEKCQIGILSNLGYLDKQRLDKQVELKKFDYVWLSFELKCRKPNEKIYKIVEEDCKIKPENILFIDDSKENIDTAKKLGWNTCNAYGYELNKIKEKVKEFLNN